MGVIFEAYTGPGSDVGTLVGTLPVRALLSESDFVNSIEGILPAARFYAAEASYISGRFGNLKGALTDASNVIFGTLLPTFSADVGDDNTPVSFFLNGNISALASAFSSQSNSFGSLNAATAVGDLFTDAANILAARATAGGLFIEQHPFNNFFSIVENFYVLIDATGYARLLLRDTVQMGSNAIAQATIVIADTLAMSDQLSKLITLFNKLSDNINFKDVIAAILRLHLASAFGLAEVVHGDLLLALSIVDRIALTAGLTSTAQVVQLVATVMALGDRLFDAQGAHAESALGISAALHADILAYAYAIDTLRMNAVPEGTMWLLATAASSAKFLDESSATAQLFAAISDGIVLTAALNLGGQPYTAWVMNTETKAMFQYTNYEFNSYAVIGGKPMAASAEGVHQLDTGDTDDGAAIIASIRSGLTNFGSAQLKRVERMYMGYASNGTLCVRVVAIGNEGTKQEYTYKMVERPATAPVTGRVPVGGGIKSTYWSFELVNNDGEYFELHDIRLLPMVLTGRLN